MIVRVLVAAAVLASSLLAAPSIAADGAASVAIEITDDQLVTLNTPPISLAAIVRELCTKAKVELRGFEAADRPVTATYDKVPLRDVLQRLLRDETYMIGVRSGDDKTRVEVAWVHVTASKIAGRTSPPAPRVPIATPSAVVAPASLSRIGLPAEVVVDALSNADEAKRRDATRTLADHFDENPTSLGAFLANDPAATVDELASYTYAGEALQTVALRQQDPVSRAKLDGIVQSLRLRSGGVSNTPGFAELMQQGLPH